MARYFVAGATGFLGSHLVDSLVQDGHEVVAVSRGGGRVGRVDVVELDVLDAGAVAARARGCDGAFLAMGRVSRDPADAEELHRTNVIGTRHALTGLRQAGVPRVVHVSTSGTVAISTEARDVGEESTPPPLELIAKWPYYRTKYYAELEALEANQAPGFEVVIVNPSLLLGPGDTRGSSTADVRRFLEGEILAVPRGGLALVDVRDAARATITAMSRGRAGERYVLSAANLEVSAFFARLARISGVPSPRLPLPRSSAIAVEATRLFGKVVKSIGGELPMDATSVDMAQHYWYCDAGKATRELDFEPRDVTDTLRDTIADLVDRGVAHPRSGLFTEGVAGLLQGAAVPLLPRGGDA